MAGAGYKLFNTGDVLTAAQVNTYLNEQTVMVFASSAARTSALSGVLAEGMMSYLQDTNAVEVYNGSSWVNVGNAGDITEVQAGVGISIASGTGPIPVITNSSTDLITTAGDLLYGTAADTVARLGIGAAGRVLKVNSGATAPEWAVDPTTDVVTTAGDLIYGTGADAVTRLGIGTAGQVLKVNSGATAPEWGAASSTSTFVGCRLIRSSGQSISNNTATKIQFNAEDFDTDGFHDNSTNNTRVTIPAGKAGKYLFTGLCALDPGAASNTGRVYSQLMKNNVGINSSFIETATTASSYETWLTNTILDLAVNDYVEWEVFHSQGASVNIDVYLSLSVAYLGA